jgi:hypothetical protein
MLGVECTHPGVVSNNGGKKKTILSRRLFRALNTFFINVHR